MIVVNNRYKKTVKSHDDTFEEKLLDMERRTTFIENVHYCTSPTCHLVNYEDADIQFFNQFTTVYDEEEQLITRPLISNPLLFKDE